MDATQRFTDLRKEIYGKEFPASTLLTAAALAVRHATCGPARERFESCRVLDRFGRALGKFFVQIVR
jgi:hypothetical protein